MKLKISYFVEISEVKYKSAETQTFVDQGYSSEFDDFDKMSEKISFDEHFVSCGGRKEEQRQRRKGGEKALPLPPPAKILTTQGKVSPKVFVKKLTRAYFQRRILKRATHSTVEPSVFYAPIKTPPTEPSVFYAPMKMFQMKNALCKMKT